VVNYITLRVFCKELQIEIDKLEVKTGYSTDTLCRQFEYCNNCTGVEFIWCYKYTCDNVKLLGMFFSILHNDLQLKIVEQLVYLTALPSLLIHARCAELSTGNSTSTQQQGGLRAYVKKLSSGWVLWVRQLIGKSFSFSLLLLLIMFQSCD
jgi:hypothetical protein